MARSYKDYDDVDAFDENGVLRDGKKVRVSFFDAITARSRLTDGAGNAGLAGCRPSYRLINDAAARDAKERAYRLYEDELVNSWRGAYEQSALIGVESEGGVCTVREGGVDEGSPGHLRRLGNRLVCVSDRRADAMSTRDERERAYTAYDDWLRNAWRNP